MGKHDRASKDFVDRLEEEWEKKNFGYSTLPMAVSARIQRASFYLQSHIARLAASCGLNSREFMAISALWRSGPPFALNPMQLLEEYFVPAATLTRQLDRLEQIGLVERRPDLQDRRAVLVELTAKGHKLVDHAMRRLSPRQPDQLVLGKLGQSELMALNRSLKKLLLLFEQQATLRAARPRTRRPSRSPRRRSRAATL